MQRAGDDIVNFRESGPDSRGAGVPGTYVFRHRGAAAARWVRAGGCLRSSPST